MKPTFLTATATSGIGSSVITWIILALFVCVIVLIKDPKFFNRKNIITSCAAIGGGIIVSITIRPFPAMFQSIVMIVLMIAILVIMWSMHF